MRPHTVWATVCGSELYNEVDDPEEMHNLAADPKHLTTATELQGLLRSMTRK
jgi:hypothetical protein